MLIKLLLKILKNKKIKSDERALILNALLEKVDGFPIKSIITYNLQGTIQINGKPLSIEQALLLKEGAISLDRNWTYQIIKDQVSWKAVEFGVHSSLSMESILFSKAALWIIEQEKTLISKISQGDDLAL